MKFLDYIRQEPVLTHALFVALVGLVASFGLELNGEQIAAMNALVLAGLSFLVRSEVTPLSNPHDATGKRLE